MTPLKTAQRYASYGWHVIPVVGKVPQGVEWHKRATNNPEMALRLFDEYHDGVGVLLGERSGIVDFDIDNSEAEEALAKFFEGVDIETPFYQSARGKHYLFKWTNKLPRPDLIKIVIDGLEIRTGSGDKGAQSVFPDSGGRKWIIDPADCPLAEIPEIVIERINARYAETQKPKKIASRPYTTDSTPDQSLDVPKWLHSRNREIIGRTDGSEGVTRFHIECPGIASHTTHNAWRDCCITQDTSGKLGGCCLHSSCGMSSWDELKRAIGEPAYDDYHPVEIIYPKIDPIGDGEAEIPVSVAKPKAEAQKPKMIIRWAGDLIREFPKEEDPVIDGLIRKGDTMNIVAPPKTGKSWCTMSMALDVAMGGKLFGEFWATPGKVLICDNELKPKSSATRLPLVAAAKGIRLDQYEYRVGFRHFRGELVDMNDLAIQLLTLEPGEFSLIILDAWYRFLPGGSDENSNGDIARLYNLIDSVAKKIGSAFVCVHHSTKGNQSGKSVTDTGAGAGSQSRAADCHLVIRQHREDGAFVIDGAVRTFAPIKPFCVRFAFPVFEKAEDLDPSDLKQDRPRREGKQANESGVSKEEQRQSAENERIQRVVEAYQAYPDGESATVLKESAGMSGTVFGPINAELIRKGIVSACSLQKNGRTVNGFKLTPSINPDNPDNSTKNESGSGCPADGEIHARTPAPPLGAVSGPGVLQKPDAKRKPESDVRVLSGSETDYYSGLFGGQSA